MFLATLLALVSLSLIILLFPYPSPKYAPFNWVRPPVLEGSHCVDKDKHSFGVHLTGGWLAGTKANKQRKDNSFGEPSV